MVCPIPSVARGSILTPKRSPRRFCLVEARSTESPGVRLWRDWIKPKGPKGPRQVLGALR